MEKREREGEGGREGARERERLHMKNLATILLLKTKLSEKFQHFNAIDGSIKMLKNS